MNEDRNSDDPMTPHGPKHDPFFHKRKLLEKPKYKGLFLEVTDFLTFILTWMAGNQELVGDLIRLQGDMKSSEEEVSGDPELLQNKMNEWYKRYIDIREAIHHIGDNRVAQVPEDDEPEEEFDPRD